MKRWIKWVAAAVLLLALAWLMVGRDYHESAAVVQDGVTFYPRADRLYAFAGIYTWDGAGDTVEYVIPDRVNGAKVTSLGGLVYGTAFKKLPYGWGLALPQTFRGAKRYHSEPPENATPITLTVHLHLGRYVSHIANMGVPDAVWYCGGDESYRLRQRWVITCDERNKTYYAEDGRLYYRQTGKPVDFDYETE